MADIDLTRLTDDELVAFIGGFYDQADPIPAGAIPASLAEAEDLLLQWLLFPPRPGARLIDGCPDLRRLADDVSGGAQ